MQQDSLIELITQLQQGQVLVVEAEAGASKTWAVMQAIAKLSSDRRVAVAAPTHVAKEELMGKLADCTQAQVQFMTTASLAGRYLQMNRNTGELENRFAPKSISYDLIACDEISAVPACDVTRMLQSNSPIVMLGDRCQLDAVMSKVADVWTDEWQRYKHRSFTFVTLEGQHRANGELYEYLHRLRTENLPLVKSIPGGRVLYSVEQFEQDWVDHMRTAYESGHDLSQYCMLAYRNETVARLQLRLRSEVFASANFVQNEVVRVDSAEGLVQANCLLC